MKATPEQDQLQSPSQHRLRSSLSACLVKAFLPLPALKRKTSSSTGGCSDSSTHAFSASATSSKSNASANGPGVSAKAVLINESLTKRYDNIVGWDEYVIPAWYTSDELQDMRQAAVREAKQVATADWARGGSNEYANVLFSTFQSLVKGESVTDATRDRLRKVLWADPETISHRLGVEEHLVPQLEMLLMKRRSQQQQMLITIQATSENPSEDKYGEELARISRRFSRPSVNFATLVAEAYYTPEEA